MPDDLGGGVLQSCIAMPAFVLPSRSLNHHPTGSRLIEGVNMAVQYATV